MILATRRQAEHGAVWSSRGVTSVRPRFVIHSHSRHGCPVVSEMGVERELSGDFVEVCHHHSMLQLPIPRYHHTTMVRFDCDPMWGIAFSEHDARNFPRPGWIRDIQTDYGVPGRYGHQIVVSGDNRDRAVGVLLSREGIHELSGRR